MPSTESHPRRRAPQAPSRLSTHHGSLRKSGTFHHSPKVATDLCDPLEDALYMPRRSPTNPAALEQLLVDAGEKRVASVIASVDRALAGKSSSNEGDVTILQDRAVFPVPGFMLDDETDQDRMQVEKKADTDRHETDSGLGSSISGSNSVRSTRSSLHSALTSDSAITRSFSTVDSTVHQNAHCLSEYATKQIQKHIIKPILREETLKDFHPLVRDVPRRIGAKSISNLRDLEKTLLFLAPEFSTSAEAYLRFCERSIRCLHTTVSHLSDQDQRLPTDRPYTINYFFDLVEQIRRYAQIIAETREKEASGQDTDAMDYSPTEKITLKGGLSHDGTPAQLVREKDGKTLPITTDHSSHSMATAGKRALDDDDECEGEDGVHRSMARRRKSDRSVEVSHTCHICSKEFRRPCDLTKHEKTHSRPWKCTEKSCKYYERGWPTEKERDRHINDKHSSAPMQFKCLYNCPYSSKRESNCKQHMEKSHGYSYVRSKSNGRKRPSDSNTSLHTPQTPATPATGMASLSTPITPFPRSPSVSYQDFNNDPFFFPDMNMTGMDDRPGSVTTSGSNMTVPSNPSSGALGIQFTPDIDTLPCFDPGLQQPTPAQSVGHDPFSDFQVPDTSLGLAGHPHLSPIGQGDAMLYSPQEGMALDEGFDDAFHPDGDFQLFEASTNPETWYGSQFDSSTYFPAEPDLGDIMGQCS